jgi:hypothetical protein
VAGDETSLDVVSEVETDVGSDVASVSAVDDSGAAVDESGTAEVGETDPPEVVLVVDAAVVDVTAA